MNIIEDWLLDLQQRLGTETLTVPEVRIGVFCCPAFYRPRRSSLYPARFKRYSLLSQIGGSSPAGRTYGRARGLDAD